MSGVWFGVDVGTVRVGVARSDPAGILASPVQTLARDTATDSDLDTLAALIAATAAESAVAGVVVGLPRTLRNAEGASAVMARDYAQALASRVAPVIVELADERLTTVSAQRKLAESGLSGRARRAVVDQVAAVELLQHWLDAHRR